MTTAAARGPFEVGPLLPVDPELARRDPAAVDADGILHVFHTVVRTSASPPEMWIEVTTSIDLRSWTTPRQVTPPVPGRNFSSPGNVVRWRDEWVMCLQSYPIRPGEEYGDETCRLWLSRSRDLVEWSTPEPLRISGSTASLRRIDPFLVIDGGRVLCLHKARGEIAILQASSLDPGSEWTALDEGRPVFTAALTPDGSTVENPAVVQDGVGWVLIAAAVRAGRGILLARSDDPTTWDPGRYLDLPVLPWAPGGPTAATVIPTPRRADPWTMLLHGDGPGPHGGALALLAATRLEGPWHAPSEE